MDQSTVGGFACCVAFIVGGIMINAPLYIFFDLPSICIVIGGTTGALFVGYPGKTILGAIKVGKKAFGLQVKRSEELIKLMQSMSYRARREGVLALEEIAEDQDDEFLKRGIQMVVDGHDPTAIEDALYGEIDQIANRHKEGAAIFEFGGTVSPAFGMIGTLIGLVNMLRNLDDPTKIGAPMAVALITTFYGCILANVFFIPMQRKLEVKSKLEVSEKELVAQGLLSILAGENPRFLVERLNSQLAPADRMQEAS